MPTAKELVEWAINQGISLPALTNPASAADITTGKEVIGADGKSFQGTRFPMADYIKTLGAAFLSTALPDTVIINAPNCTGLVSAFNAASGVKTLDIKVSDATANLQNAFFTTAIETIVIRFSTHNVTIWTGTFANGLKNIIGELDFSNASAAISLSANMLITIETIMPSSIKQNFTLTTSSLSSASSLQVGNGLDAAASGKTLTLSATQKAAFDALMVDNVDGTAIEGVTMSLTAFITTIKGWSVATA